MTTPGTRPNPAAICAMRMRGEGPLAPKATMCEERIEAPALVPATTTPCLVPLLDLPRQRGAGHDAGQAHLVAAGEEDAGHFVQDLGDLGRGGRGAVRQIEHVRALGAHAEEDRLVALTRFFDGRGRGDDGDPGIRSTGEVDECGEDELVAELVLRAADGHHRPGGDDAIWSRMPQAALPPSR